MPESRACAPGRPAPVRKPEMRNEMERYLSMTGQTKQQLLAGGMKTGSRLFSELIPEALRTHKKLVWHESTGHLGSDKGHYSFDDL